MYSDNSDGDTPISMPNIEVKPISAESTWLEAAWKDRTLLNRKSISYEVLFLLPLSSQVASGLACYVGKHKLNFRNRELLDERQYLPFREIEASLSQIWLKPYNSGVSL